MKIFNSFLSYFLVALFVMGLVFSSCTKDDGDAPQIPPKSTFVMDLNEFDTTNVPEKRALDTTIVNWSHSAWNAFVWNVVITINGVVPVAAFNESFNHTPKWDKKKKVWIWSYNVNIYPHTYECALHGKISGDEVTWEMYISQNNGFQDYLWFSGVCDVARTKGSWLLNRGPLFSTPYISIDWNRSSDNSIADIKYTNVIPGNAENGGYIMYGINTNTDYNAFYDIYNKGKNNLTEIKWHRTNKNGKVKDFDKFSDSEWHCWDTSLLDAVCN